MIRYPEKLRSAAKYAKKAGDPATELVTIAVPGQTIQARVTPSTRAKIAELLREVLVEDGWRQQNAN